MKRCLPVLVMLITLSLTSLAQICKDLSFRVDYASPGIVLLGRHSTTTADTGTLVTGSCRDNSTTDQFVLKTTSDGQVAWSKRIAYANPGMADLYLDRVFECSDRSVIIIGRLDSIGYSNSLYISKLGPAGNLLWEKRIDNSIPNPMPDTKLWVAGITEGDNGDLYLAAGLYFEDEGTSYFVFCKLDAGGNLIWNKGLGFLSGGNDITINGLYKNGNQLDVMGSFLQGGCKNGDVFRIFTTHVDVNNGNSIGWKQYATTLPVDPAGSVLVAAGAFQSGRNGARLANGEYRMAGVLFGFDFSFNTDIPYHYVINFDQQLVPTQTSLFRFDRQYATHSGFNREGKAMLVLARSSPGRLYYGMLDNTNRQVVFERKMNLQMASSSVVAVPNNWGLLSFKQGNVFSLVTNINDGGNRTLEIAQLQPDDITDGNCTGEDTSYLTKGPPISLFRCNTAPDIVYNSPLSMGAIITTGMALPMVVTDVCRKEYTCTDLKIAGADSVCMNTVTYDYVAKLNGDCGKKVSWDIDRRYIQSLQILNDSMVRIAFTSVSAMPVNVKLYATTDGCNLLQDSLTITIRTAGRGLLGNGRPDTTLCPGQSVKLTPGNWFTGYQWSDGSTDSVLQVTVPGTYTCKVSLCTSSAIMQVVVRGPAKALQANDAVMCSGEPVVLKSTGGLSQYNWSPAYHLTRLTDSTVQVSPVMDTAYIVAAALFPGCVLRDTVHVTVNPSPVMSLGKDTGICVGATVQLNGGAHFAAYQWSNGFTGQTIMQAAPGRYWLEVTDDSGCKARDTIEVSTQGCGEKIVFPNAFSPDGNGHNDVFKPFVRGYLIKYSLRVYNRWGQCIFQSVNPLQGWDGSWQSKRQSSGTFVWVCQYQFTDQPLVTEKGVINLIR